MWCVYCFPLRETVLTPTKIACLPLLRPLLKNVAENRSTVYSSQARWFSTRSRSVGNNVDEVPLTQVVSDVNHMLLPLSPLLISGSTTPRNTMRSTERFSVC
jgi:hypothetical protein